MERLLGKFLQAVEARAAPRQDESGGDLAVKPSALQIIANQGEQFHGARLDNVRKHVREDGPRRTVAHAGNLDGTVSDHEGGRGAAVAALDSFRLGDGGAQRDGPIIEESIDANANGP